MGISKRVWGIHNDQEIHRITLSNGYLELTVTNLGCTILGIALPDANGHLKNMVLSYDRLEDYLSDTYYLGCIVGRVANRISGAAFGIAGTTYPLAANDGTTGNHLHGGIEGFNKKIFRLVSLSNAGHPTVQFAYHSPDGEEGYPGNLEVSITYTLTQKNEVVIDYRATTDKPTPVNLTSHCYFNLSGTAAPALDHELFIDAETVLEADAAYIPTGVLKNVRSTNLDFTKWRPIASQDSGQPFSGINDYFSFAHADAPQDIKAGLGHSASGRSLTMRTTLPGVMLYTGDYLQTPFQKNGGICLEAHFVPDSVNRPEFPSTLLYPGEVYQHQTVYQFFD